MSNMVIQTNILALNSHRNMKLVGSEQYKASSRLSSGFRINSAADDAAGLAISEKMRAQIRGLDMASKNTQDGISLIQTAEGGLQEIDNMVQRIRELVVQVSNDTNEHNTVGSGDRQKIQDEINQLTEEIDSMAERVEFNKKKVINGSYSDTSVLLANAQKELAVALAGGPSSLTGLQIKSVAARIVSAAASLAPAVASLSSFAQSVTSLGLAAASLQQAFKAGSMEMASFASYFGSIQGDLASAQSEYNRVGQEAASLQGEISGLMKMIPSASGNNLLIDALQKKVSAISLAPKGDALYFQLGANAFQGISVNIGSAKTDFLGIGNGEGKSSINVLNDTGENITGYLDVLDLALSYVTTERSKLGATQNRLEYTGKSLDISSENLSASESRIRDADMAKEMMRLTKTNVLQQAAVSMLAQGNQSPQSILQLLR